MVPFSDKKARVRKEEIAEMRNNVLTLGILGLSLVSQSVQGGTWYVDGSVAQSGGGSSWETAFETVQEGIDAASDTDTVVVSEGTYVENIHFDGKNIVLRSRDPLDPGIVQSTIIDGDQLNPVVTFSGTENETCVLAGFTIRNGMALYGGKYGGGVYGGGVYEPRTHATIRNNIITQNRAPST